MNFSSALSDRPTIFMAFWPVKWTNFRSCRVSQPMLSQKTTPVSYTHLDVYKRQIMSKKVAPYYFLGFLLAAYLGVPVLGVAALGLILVLTKFDFNLSTLKTSAAETGEVAQNDDDF